MNWEHKNAANAACLLIHDDHKSSWQVAEVKSIGYYAFEKGKNDVPNDADIALEISLIRFGDDDRTPISNLTLLFFLSGFLLVLYIINGGTLPSTGLQRSLD